MRVADLSKKRSGSLLRKSFDDIIGHHPSLTRAKIATERARGLRILFFGETGTGKTPFARYSNRILSAHEGRPRPFEQVNCACLNPDHFQDILFGHKKGAFTGAVSDKAGLVELARGGDLFLDEIGDMPLNTQSYLLTFLDSLEYYRLGDDQKRRAEVRLISATNRDLGRLVQQGLFRKDLYSRISQVVVPIPPLRERTSDIPELFAHFVKLFCGFAKPYDPHLLTIFQRTRWEEGNVREMQDAVEFLCLMAEEKERIEVSDLGDRLLEGAPGYGSGNDSSGIQDSLPEVREVGLERYLDEIERGVLEECLQQKKVRLGQLARELKISRSTLYRRMRRLNLTDQLSSE